MSIPIIRLLFAIAGIYDFALAIAFLFFGPTLYDRAGITEPNHWGYVQFAALLLLIFGLMFGAVAANPFGNRNLIPYGIMLKASYVGVAAYHWINSDIPTLFKPFAIIDAFMLVLFVVAYNSLGKSRN